MLCRQAYLILSYKLKDCELKIKVLKPFPLNFYISIKPEIANTVNKIYVYCILVYVYVLVYVYCIQVYTVYTRALNLYNCISKEPRVGAPIAVLRIYDQETQGATVKVIEY